MRDPRAVEVAVLDNVYETFKQEILDKFAEAGGKTEITKFLN